MAEYWVDVNGEWPGAFKSLEEVEKHLQGGDVVYVKGQQEGRKWFGSYNDFLAPNIDEDFSTGRNILCGVW